MGRYEKEEEGKGEREGSCAPPETEVWLRHCCRVRGLITSAMIQVDILLYYGTLTVLCDVL